MKELVQEAAKHGTVSVSVLVVALFGVVPVLWKAGILDKPVFAGELQQAQVEQQAWVTRQFKINAKEQRLKQIGDLKWAAEVERDKAAVAGHPVGPYAQRIRGLEGEQDELTRELELCYDPGKVCPD